MLKKVMLLAVVCALIAACDSKDAGTKAKNKAMNIESEEVVEVNTASEPEVGGNIAQPQTPQTAKMSEDIQASSGNSVEDDYAAWLHQVALPNLQKKCSQKGVDLSLPECTQNALFYGDGAVMLSPEDPNWVNARSLAYNKALVQAYQKVAEYLSLTNEVKMMQELFRDSERPTLGEDVKSNIDILLDKSVALVGGAIDNKLVEYGIDPAQFNSASDSTKKTMLRDAISTQSVKLAIASTTGMIPYQTFEGKNQDGAHVIRVVVSAEPDRIALVKTILLKRAQIMPNLDKKAQKSLYDRLVLGREVLVNQFGTRLMYDEQGYPVLVAFGQAGIEKSATHSGRAARSEIAQRKAVANADAVLTLLLNSTTSSKEITKQVLQHLEEEKVISEKAAGTVTNELSETDTYNEYIDSKTTVSGRIQNFAGRSEFYNWSYEFPKTNHKVAGVILVWSPQAAQHAQGIKAAKPLSGTAATKSSGSAGNLIPTNVIRGIESDF